MPKVLRVILSEDEAQKLEEIGSDLGFTSTDELLEHLVQNALSRGDGVPRETPPDPRLDFDDPRLETSRGVSRETPRGVQDDGYGGVPDDYPEDEVGRVPRETSPQPHRPGKKGPVLSLLRDQFEVVETGPTLSGPSTTVGAGSRTSVEYVDAPREKTDEEIIEEDALRNYRDPATWGASLSPKSLKTFQRIMMNGARIKARNRLRDSRGLGPEGVSRETSEDASLVRLKDKKPRATRVIWRLWDDTEEESLPVSTWLTWFGHLYRR